MADIPMSLPKNSTEFLVRIKYWGNLVKLDLFIKKNSTNLDINSQSRGSLEHLNRLSLTSRSNEAKIYEKRLAFRKKTL